MLHDTTSLHGIDRVALLRVVEPIVRAHGAELVDLEFKPDRGSWVLRLYVEKEGSLAGRLSTRDAAVDLDLCANVSRDLSPALDVADLIPHAYRLEISSPGVERPLRGEGDFTRFKGHKAKVRRRLPDGQAGEEGGVAGRVLVGILDGVVDGHLHLLDGDRTHQVPLAAVESANLVFEFGAAPARTSGEPRRGHHGNREHRKPEHRKH